MTDLEQNVIELLFTDRNGKYSVVVLDTDHNRSQVANCRAPFLKEVIYRKQQKDDHLETDTELYLPIFHNYMTDMKMWLIGKEDLREDHLDDLQELLTVELNVRCDKAYRLTIHRKDYYGTLYIPMTAQNQLEFDSIPTEITKHFEIDIVDLEFAKAHPKNFKATGLVKKEECVFLEKIQLPRKDVNKYNNLKELLMSELSC